MGLNLKILKMSPELFTWCYIQKALPTRLIISLMLLFAKTLRTVMALWWHYDVRKYTADTILFREIQCKKSDVLTVFSAAFGWNKVKYARITITHVCFIALTLAGSLGRCLSTRPLIQTPFSGPANVNAWKNMCDPYKQLDWAIASSPGPIWLINWDLLRKKLSSWFAPMLWSNQPSKLQGLTRSFKLCVALVQLLYYSESEFQWYWSDWCWHATKSGFVCSELGSARIMKSEIRWAVSVT